MLPQEFTVGWKEFARTTLSLCMWLVTLIEGKLSQAACAFLFLLVTQTHRKFSTGLQEQIKAWLDFGIGNSTHTTKVPSLGLSGVGGIGRGKGRGRHTIHGQNTSKTETLPQHSLKHHIRWADGTTEKHPEDHRLLLHSKQNSGRYCKKCKVKAGDVHNLWELRLSLEPQICNHSAASWILEAPGVTGQSSPLPSNVSQI